MPGWIRASTMPEPAHATGSSNGERSVVRELIAFASRTPLSAAGAIVGLLIVAIALGANWVAPLDPLKTNFRRMNHEPDAQSLFGTDQVGRDTLSRVIHGARTSLFVPEWKKFFVAVPRDKDRAAELRVFDVIP